MKKILLLLLLIPLCSALEFNPSTVDSMDVTIATTASGSFSGNITSRDEMKVMFLTIQKSDTQEILSLEEYMQIGNTRQRAFKEEKNGLTYATYTINDLLEFANENEFIIVRKARIKTQSQIGLGQDYNLAEEIKGFDKYINPSDYGNIQQVLFEVSIAVPTANQNVSVQLYNQTANHPVWFSQVSMNAGNTTAYLVSNPISLDPGSNLYLVQMQTQLGSSATVSQARVHIITY